MSARIVSPTPDAVHEAALRLRDGGLVAFPTETVYGLGANALDEGAVARIFAAKGRPSTNPVIVHVANVEAARALVSEWPPLAQKLAHAFWPGPLTLVLPKAAPIPDIVTASGPTVGVRVPAHPVALELLAAAGVPLAAPSANRSEEISPTLARHVADSLQAFVDDLLVLDGGPCRVGLESTVLDVTGNVPRILRPGMVTAQMLREVVGNVLENGANGDGGPERSPGQMVRHYAPHKPLLLVPADALMGVVQKGDAVWLHGPSGPLPLPIELLVKEGVLPFLAPPRAESYAHVLYHKLRRLDDAPNVRRIVIVEPPHTPEWAAVHDRLRRAAAKKNEA